MDNITSDLKELQQIELGILLDVADFCFSNGLRFYLSEGTLLGAVRHHGFIPWDDDIDIAMPRDDYERFLKIAPDGLSGKYEIQHYSTIENCWFSITKVRLITDMAKFRQENVAHLTKNNGPLIDIFPLDSVPKKQGFRQNMNRRWIGIYKYLLLYKSGAYRPPLVKKSASFMQKAKAKLRKVAIKALMPFVTLNSLQKKLNKRYQRFNSNENTYLVNWGSWYALRRETFNASDYSEPVLMPFEGHELPVPCGYDSVLTTIYGDYMTPPPQYLQYSKHNFDDTSASKS